MSTSVLISTNDSTLAQALANKIDKSAEVVECGTTLEEITEALGEKSFGCLFISPMKDDNALFSLISGIHESFGDINIVAATLSGNTAETKALIGSERVMVVQMPISCDRLANLVVHIGANSTREFYPYIADTAYLLGFRHKYDGFDYLCSAVSLVIGDPGIKNAIVKKVYGAVAEEYGMSTVMVDRSLRYLSQAAFDDGIVPKLTNGQLNTRLTNYEMICAVGDCFLTRKATYFGFDGE